MRSSARKRRKTIDEPLVGSLCRKNFFTIPVDFTVKGAIARIREWGQRGNIFYLYVVDNDGVLHGVISIRNLLLAQDDESIQSLYSKQIVTISETSLRSEAYRLFANAKFLSLPVVDGTGRIVGVVHAHELAEESSNKIDTLFEERSRGELFELLGIKAEHASKAIVPTALGRLPWLLVNIVGGTCSAFFIHHFGGGLAKAVLYLAFVPILLILSESLGMQTASIVIANLHKMKQKQSDGGLFRREFLIAATQGLICSILVAGAVHFWMNDSSLSLSILNTIFLGTILVSALGNAVPRLFHRFRVDPRIAAGPVVLAIADCSVLLLYLLVALWISK